MGKRYELCYWGYNPKDTSGTILLCKEVLVPKETELIMRMANNSTRFYRFIVDDGEDFLVAADCIHSIRKIYSNENE